MDFCIESDIFNEAADTEKDLRYRIFQFKLQLPVDAARCGGVNKVNQIRVRQVLGCLAVQPENNPVNAKGQKVDELRLSRVRVDKVDRRRQESRKEADLSEGNNQLTKQRIISECLEWTNVDEFKNEVIFAVVDS
jgi:hypothetical protein